MLYLFLANGFETIEALTPLDMLRRAEIDVQTVGITGKTVISAHRVPVVADVAEDEMQLDGLEGIILPGGGIGTHNLEASSIVATYLSHCVKHHLLICAICAAPSILGKRGHLENRTATAFPSFQQFLPNVSDEFVVTDGNIITARGAGVSTQFGLEIVKYLKGKNKANEIKDLIQWNNY